MEIEVHPFKAFVPRNATVLIVGTFPGKDITHKLLNENDWFYGTKRNQFWKIIAGVYKVEVTTKKQKQTLLEERGIAIADLFLKVKRTAGNNTDGNLQVIQFNDEDLKKIIKYPTLQHIFFTSQFVEKEFLKVFPSVSIGESLPSPSPRFATMSLATKIEIYKSKLPK